MPYIGNPIYQSAFVTDTFSGTGSQTAFTMSVAPAGTTNVLVVVSGVVQDPSTYGVTGNTLNFSTAPPSGTGNISCRYLGVPVTGVVTTAYRTKTEFTATAGQTTFTPPSYTVGYIDVFRNGVLLGSADYTASNGTTVVLATGATAGDLVTVESFLVSSVLNAIANTPGAINVGGSLISGVLPVANGGTGINASVSTSTVSALVVAGGGGGGGAQNTPGGAGGGGGGFQTASSISVSSGTAYTITIGSGGTAGGPGYGTGGNGGNSAFASFLTATGGGGGGSYSATKQGQNGGSGGGSAWPSTSSGGTGSQGNAGGFNNTNGNYQGGGGGGGAGAAGGNAGTADQTGGYGGNGATSSITGILTYYAGGGGGAAGTGQTPYTVSGYGGLGGGGMGGIGSVLGSNGVNGLPNTGGGGGGGGASVSSPSYSVWSGGAGGSGVVIIAYPNTYKQATVTGNYMLSQANGNWVYTFSSSGTITF